MTQPNPSVNAIREIMAKVLRLKINEIDDNTSTESTEGWDSLAHLNLISSLEDELRIRFTTDEIVGMKSYQNIVHVIKSKID